MDADLIAELFVLMDNKLRLIKELGKEKNEREKLRIEADIEKVDHALTLQLRKLRES